MILSRTLAKRRLEEDRRPGWLGAWLPVLIDTLISFGVLISIWLPLLRALDAGLVTTVLIGFFGFFLPVQYVIITSAMWATRSRWLQPEED